MKVKIKIQVGAYDRKPEDLYVLLGDPKEVFNDLHFETYLRAKDFRVTQHRLLDGCVHLIEWDLERLI